MYIFRKNDMYNKTDVAYYMFFKPGTCLIQTWSVAAKFCFMLLARPVPTDTNKASE